MNFPYRGTDVYAPALLPTVHIPFLNARPKDATPTRELVYEGSSTAWAKAHGVVAPRDEQIRIYRTIR